MSETKKPDDIDNWVADGRETLDLLERSYRKAAADLTAERAAHEATKRELEEEKGAYDKLRAEVERLKGELARREDQTVGESISMKDEDLCLKRCVHESECLHQAGHGDRHETQHGCIFYDRAIDVQQTQPEPAKGVDEWKADRSHYHGGAWGVACGGRWWKIDLGDEHARSLAEAINASIARGRAERGDDGTRWHILYCDNKSLSFPGEYTRADAETVVRCSAEKAYHMEKVATPARYVVKVSGTTQPYDTKAGAETEANALRQNWGINAKVEEK